MNTHIKTKGVLLINTPSNENVSIVVEYTVKTVGVLLMNAHIKDSGGILLMSTLNKDSLRYC